MSAWHGDSFLLDRETHHAEHDRVYNSTLTICSFIILFVAYRETAMDKIFMPWNQTTWLYTPDKQRNSGTFGRLYPLIELFQGDFLPRKKAT